jgi:hypothetical protein
MRKPYVVWVRVLSVPKKIGRFARYDKARTKAYDERGFVSHVEDLDADMRKALGVRS